MTTPNLEQIIAKAINDDGWTCDIHEPHDFGECTQCRDTQLHTAAHVVAVIRDSGYTVIALPAPTGSDDSGTEWLDGEVFVGSPGNGRVRCYLEDARLNDDDAADLGAALLAAAQVAERNNHE